MQRQQQQQQTAETTRIRRITPLLPFLPHRHQPLSQDAASWSGKRTSSRLYSVLLEDSPVRSTDGGTSVKEAESSSVVNDSTPTSKWTAGYATNADIDHTGLADDLVRALDLPNVIDMVAVHCGTFRGRHSLLQMVGQDIVTNGKRSQGRNGRSDSASGSRRSRLLEQFQTTAPLSSSSHSPLNNAEHHQICNTRMISPIAQSAHDVAFGYRLVQEATSLIEKSVRQASDSSNVLPPLYGSTAQGPLNVEAAQLLSQSDDDEWIHLASPLASYASTGDESWTLEHVLQAQCVLTKLVQTEQWVQDTIGTSSTLARWMSNALTLESDSSVGLNTYRSTKSSIRERLEPILAKVADAVHIVRVRTLLDVSGRSSYSFQLSSRRFPELGQLRERYDALQQQQQNGYNGKNQQGDAQKLATLKDEIATLETTIARDLFTALYSVRDIVNAGLDAVAALDVVFAKAAFGYKMASAASSFHSHCKIASSNEKCSSHKGGCAIHVEQFVHPLLYQAKPEAVVPIDLILGDTNDDKALVISGSNGGGKSVAMKSFGLVAVMAKLSIPVVSASSNKDQPLIDFFDDVIVSVGDYQNVQDGESTYTAQLKRYATVIDRVAGRGVDLSDNRLESQTTLPSCLVLLDEIGGGTEESSGGAIGQAVLEKLLATSESCRAVATTHSPRLKTWAFNNSNSYVRCAAVLLDRIPTDGTAADSAYRKPSYRLQYNCIGDSYAFGAASRCLPEDVVLRASELMDEEIEVEGSTMTSYSSSYMRALTESLELQLTMATEHAEVANLQAHDTAMLQRAMKSLAAAYDDHLSRLESRIHQCYQALLQQETQTKAAGAVASVNSLQVLGGTLSELRLVHARVKTERELLSERGLKRLPESYTLSPRETVVVVDDSCEWHGLTATVVSATNGQMPLDPQHRLTRNDILVEFSGSAWDFAFVSHDKMAAASADANLVGRTVLQRYQLAIWEYSSQPDSSGRSASDISSIPDSKRKLNSLLTALNTITVAPRPVKSAHAKTSNGTRSGSSTFGSSRERKAAKRTTKGKK